MRGGRVHRSETRIGKPGTNSCEPPVEALIMGDVVVVLPGWKVESLGGEDHSKSSVDLVLLSQIL